ncbi:MAG TPA: hypothetical protein VEB87_02095 [Nitrososphaerales archaeon]|nr:hypothetical protein [Nitrososphaerales archaeon]
MKSMSKGGLVVMVVVVGAAAFGLFLGYLAYTNDSFPAQQRPFGDYASVVYSSFNGTELAFRVQWLNSGYVPLYAQVTSQSTDAANTPVCSIGLSAVQSGQVVFLPFGISQASVTLNNVDLSLAVKSATNSTQFTIVYTVPSISASNATITPSNLTCQEPAGVE